MTDTPNTDAALAAIAARRTRDLAIDAAIMKLCSILHPRDTWREIQDNSFTTVNPSRESYGIELYGQPLARIQLLSNDSFTMTVLRR